MKLKFLKHTLVLQPYYTATSIVHLHSIRSAKKWWEVMNKILGYNRNMIMWNRLSLFFQLTTNSAQFFLAYVLPGLFIILSVSIDKFCFTAVLHMLHWLIDLCLPFQRCINQNKYEVNINALIFDKGTLIVWLYQVVQIKSNLFWGT